MSSTTTYSPKIVFWRIISVGEPGIKGTLVFRGQSPSVRRRKIDFQLTEGQKMLRKMVRDFAAKEISPRIAVIQEDEPLPVELRSALAGLGLLGMCLPSEYGGDDRPNHICPNIGVPSNHVLIFSHQREGMYSGGEKE